MKTKILKVLFFMGFSLISVKQIVSMEKQSNQREFEPFLCPNVNCNYKINVDNHCRMAKCKSCNMIACKICEEEYYNAESPRGEKRISYHDCKFRSCSGCKKIGNKDTFVYKAKNKYRNRKIYGRRIESYCKCDFGKSDGESDNALPQMSVDHTSIVYSDPINANSRQASIDHVSKDYIITGLIGTGIGYIVSKLIKLYKRPAQGSKDKSDISRKEQTKTNNKSKWMVFSLTAASLFTGLTAKKLIFHHILI